MKALNKFPLGFIGALAVAGAAYGQQPPDVVNSDAYGNTAMGTNALFRLTPNPPYQGINNTASGFQALYSNTTGDFNTASGYYALFSNTGGGFNTASGYQALYSNTSDENTASGYQALYSNTTGFANTASGFQALLTNTSGQENTAFGYGALSTNSTGNYNTASGAGALGENATGSYSTASGYSALAANTTGASNTAFGYEALAFNTTGNNNTAAGFQALNSGLDTAGNPDGTGSNNTAAGVAALYSYTTGSNNTGSGYQALYSNTTGNYNSATGVQALHANTTGSNNIAEGYQAGYYLTTGSNNIDIGDIGVAGESDTIRIGTKGTQKATYIAGIYSTSMTGHEVLISSTGQLGVKVSSERFKTHIATMDSNTTKLQQLRPVTFKLKSDPKGALQYGLIAEEVAKVYPELVIRDENGRIDGVRYDELAPMLLNEVQQQAAEIRDMRQQLAELNNLKQEMHAALGALKSRDQLVAQR